MKRMAGVKRTSIEDVMKSKECVCGKRFWENENKPNINTHCKHCDTFKFPPIFQWEHTEHTVGTPVDSECSSNETSQVTNTLIDENVKFCKDFQMFSMSDFFSFYPLGVHSSQNTENKVFQTFAPFDGQFKVFENLTDICEDSNSLKSLNCVQGILERASYNELKQCKNTYMNHIQMIEKLEQQKATFDKLKLSHFNDETKALQIYKES